MIQIEVDDAGIIRDCTVSGNAFEVAAQISGAICSIYHIITLANEEIAEQFRFAISCLTKEDGRTWDTSMLRKTGNGMCCYVMPPDYEEENERWND